MDPYPQTHHYRVQPKPLKTGGYSQTQKEGLANLFSTLQPHVVAFGAAGLCASPARWVGTESGFAPYPCWSTVKAISDDGAGDPNGSLWIPAETDLCVA